MEALLDAAKTSLLCGRQLCLQKCQSYDENDKGLLIVDQWPPGLTSNVGLDLT